MSTRGSSSSAEKNRCPAPCMSDSRSNDPSLAVVRHRVSMKRAATRALPVTTEIIPVSVVQRRPPLTGAQRQKRCKDKKRDERRDAKALELLSLDAGLLARREAGRRHSAAYRARQAAGGAPRPRAPDPQGAAMKSHPRPFPSLGPNLKTFVINLERRPDRRDHITAVCKALNLNYELVKAVDGKALACSPGAELQVQAKTPAKRPRAPSRSTASSSAAAPAKKTADEQVVNQRSKTFKECKEKLRAAIKKRSFDEAATPQSKPNGFGGLKISTYNAKWLENGVQQSQLLTMAEHRLGTTELTPYGHELWGAVGCSRSHQLVFRRILDDPDCDFALILEDDASLAMSAAEAQKKFDLGMRNIVEKFPDWGLVYLGGHFSTNLKKQDRASLRLDAHVSRAMQVYQTHAFIIRRCLLETILEKLARGHAADAALSSWSKSQAAKDRCFMYYPEQLLQQPGGPNRWKDSDIFVEGELFRLKSKELHGRYCFSSNLDRKKAGGPPTQTLQRLAEPASVVDEQPRLLVNRVVEQLESGHLVLQARRQVRELLEEMIKDSSERPSEDAPTVVVSARRELLAISRDLLEELSCGSRGASCSREKCQMLADRAAKTAKLIKASLSSADMQADLILRAQRAGIMAFVDVLVKTESWLEGLFLAVRRLVRGPLPEGQASIDGAGSVVATAAAARCALQYSFGVAQELAKDAMRALCMAPERRDHAEHIAAAWALAKIQTRFYASRAFVSDPSLRDSVQLFALVGAEVLQDMQEKIEATEERLAEAGQARRGLTSILTLALRATAAAEQARSAVGSQRGASREPGRPPPGAAGHYGRPEPPPLGGVEPPDMSAIAPTHAAIRRPPSAARLSPENTWRRAEDRRGGAPLIERGGPGSQTQHLPRTIEERVASKAAVGAPAYPTSDSAAQPAKRTRPDAPRQASLGSAPKKKKKKKTVPAEAEKNRVPDRPSRAELSGLTVSELRSKARYYGVSSTRLWCCVEKEDLIEALMETGYATRSVTLSV